MGELKHEHLVYMIPEGETRNGKNRQATDWKILIIEANQILSSGYADDGSVYLKD